MSEQGDALPQSKTPWVGRSIPRHEDHRLVTGRGHFAADFDHPRQLHCAIVASPHARARIRSVDLAPALAMPGVGVAISGADAKAHWGPLPACFEGFGIRLPEFYALAVDRVCYCGEPVAAVAAEDPYLAQDAARAIRVDYEELPPILSIDAALADSGAELVHPTWPDNRQLEWDFRFGDVDGLFASAKHRVRAEVRAHRYSAVPLEARALLAEYDAADKSLRVRLSTQIPHQARTIFASIFGLPEPQVRVLSEDVGGGFGNKLQVDIEPIPILLSILSARPVKWVERRSEWMASAPASRDFVHQLEGAFDETGRLRALRATLRGDLGCDGAVRTGGSGAFVVAGTYTPGTYDIDAYEVRVECAVTNKAPYGAYRGYGKDIANLGIERLFDAASQELEIDGVELRRRNLIDRYPYEMVTGPVIESGSLKTCLDRIVRAMDLPTLREEQSRARSEGRYLGLGVVSVLEPSAASIPMSMFNGYESATVRVSPSGDVSVLTGMQHIGQGVETAMAQVVADAIACRPDQVHVRWGDTDVVPYGLGAYSSRGATYGVSAAHEAATAVRKKLHTAAANLLESDEGTLEAGDGFYWVRGEPERRLSIAEIARAVYFFPGPYTVLPGVPNPTLEASHAWTNPQVSWVPDAHGRLRVYPSHASGAQGAWVEVDIETGQVTTHRLWISHDAGKVIHPRIVEGQIIGGTIQGYGGVMMEELRYDEHGRFQSTTLGDYGLPTILSAPPVEVLHGEVPSPVTPLGTKGVGEAGCIGTPTVMMQAIEDALAPLGVKLYDSPLSPERLLAAIDEAG